MIDVEERIDVKKRFLVSVEMCFFREIVSLFSFESLFSHVINSHMTFPAGDI